VFDSSRKYQVSVEIENFYAPVKKLESGLLNVSVSEKDQSSAKKSTFSMSIEDWVNVVKQMELARDCFMMVNYQRAWRVSNEAILKGIEEAKNSKQ
jgi:hypothetical protein